MNDVKFYKERGGELANVMHEVACAYGETHGLVTLDYCAAAAILFFQAAKLFENQGVQGVSTRMAVSIELAIMNEIVKKNDGIELFKDITSSTLNGLFGVEYVDFLSDDEKKEFERILSNGRYQQ